MKKKFIALNTTIMIGLGSVFSIPAVQAESISNIQSERAEIQSEIADAKNIIQDLQAQQTKLTKQIKQIKQAMKENNKKIKKTTKQISETEADIKVLQEEIAILEKRILQRQEVLKERALSFQETGGNVDVIELLFGASNFADFLSRVGAVATIAEADRDILTQQETDKADLEKKKAVVEEKLKDLKDMKVELEGMQAQIKEQKQQSEKTVAKLEAKEKQTANLKKSLEKKDANLSAQIAAIKAEKKREAARQVAQEKALQEAARQAQKTTASSNNRSSSTDDSTSSTSRKSSTTASAPSSSANVGSAITAGYRYIGNSTYVFGGGRTASDIANGRFDCSSFVAWAYRQAGVSLPAYTSALVGAGTQVSTSQMQPGDLVFFNTYKTDGHVGIYLGGGKFIGAQSSTGVAIASMDSGYWAGVFNGRVVRVN